MVEIAGKECWKSNGRNGSEKPESPGAGKGENSDGKMDEKGIG